MDSMQAILLVALVYIALTWPVSAEDEYDSIADTAIQFAARVSHGLLQNDGNVSLTASQFRAEFDDLSADTNHTLGDALSQLLVMRVADLSATLDQTLTLQSVLYELQTPK